MKNLILTTILLFTATINAQYAIISAVDVKEGSDEGYLKLEEFFANGILPDLRKKLTKNCLLIEYSSLARGSKKFESLRLLINFHTGSFIC